jgi:predicted secreted protein
MIRLARNAGGLFLLLGLIAVGVGLFSAPQIFWSSYMFAFVFWGGMTLGATTLTYLHHSIRATWSVAILRILESANKTIPYFACLCAVLVVGMFTKQIYQWGDPALVAQSEILQKKEYWLNPIGFTVRAVFYFAFWWWTTHILNSSSRRQDETGDDSLGDRRATIAAPLGVVHVILLTLAFTDWVMSLDPAWFSTIYGALFMIGQILAILSMSLIIFLRLRDKRPYNTVVHTQVVRDLGTVMLGFTMFWTYFTLSQFLIIWSGNLPEEIPFYINRFSGGMNIIGGFVVLFQFFTPFVALLSVRLKRDPSILWPVALLVLVVRIVDTWWQVIPFFRVGADALNIGNIAMDLGVWAAVGGLWVILFTSNLLQFAQDNLLVVKHDTRLLEGKIAEAHHHA